DHSLRPLSLKQLLEVKTAGRDRRAVGIINAIGEEWSTARIPWSSLREDLTRASNAEVLRSRWLLDGECSGSHVPGYAPACIPALTGAEVSAIGISDTRFIRGAGEGEAAAVAQEAGGPALMRSEAAIFGVEVEQHHRASDARLR